MDDETREEFRKLHERFDKMEGSINERFSLVVKMLKIIDGRIRKVEAAHEETF